MPAGRGQLQGLRLQDLRDEVALCLVAPELAQSVELLAGLDPLGHDLLAQGVGGRDGGRDDRCCLRYHRPRLRPYSGPRIGSTRRRAEIGGTYANSILMSLMRGNNPVHAI